MRKLQGQFPSPPCPFTNICHSVIIQPVIYISQALLSHYENGLREPGLGFVDAACSYYGVSADYLLGRSEVRASFARAGASPALRRMTENGVQALLAMLEGLEDAPEASFTVFVPDRKKAGGKYAVLRGRLSRFDEYARSITLDSGEVIPIEHIAGIEWEGLEL